MRHSTANSATPAPSGFTRLVLAALLLGGTALVALHDWAGLGGPSWDHAIGGPVYDAVIVGAGLACIGRAALARGERVAWLLIGLSVLAWGAGEIYWTVAIIDDPAPPYPSWADAGYLVFYPLAIAGLVALMRARIGDLDRSLLLDGLIAGLGTAALGTAFVFDYVRSSVTGTPIEVATTMAYPLGDILLIGMVTAIVALTGWRPGRTWALLLVGMAVMAFADIVYTLQWTSETFPPGTWIEPFWLIAAAAIGIAAWEPSRRFARGGVRIERPRELVVPLIFAAITLGILAQHYAGRPSALSVILLAGTIAAIIGRLGVSVRQNRNLLEQVRTDPLTGLGNRGRLQVDLHRQLALASEQHPRALLLFDLDGFKLYNDTFGHPAGDSLLERFGTSLREAVGTDGTAYRIGGDEFCVLLTCEQSHFGTVATRAARALKEDGVGFDVTSSWGAVVIPAEASDPASAIQLADVRMYERKDSGRVSAGSQVEEALITAMEERQPDLGAHVHEVAGLAFAVGERLGLPPGELTLLRRAAELHDIGKVAIPEAILDKTGPLTAEELEFVRRHTVLGERIISAAPSLAPVAGIVRSSHERFDGDGYPDGLAGEQIPLASRIVFACDAFHAMTTDRPYSVARSVVDALQELRVCAGGQFDPRVVEALCAEVTAPSTGRVVNTRKDHVAVPSGLASRPAVDSPAAV